MNFQLLQLPNVLFKRADTSFTRDFVFSFGIQASSDICERVNDPAYRVDRLDKLSRVYPGQYSDGCPEGITDAMGTYKPQDK